MGPPPLQPFASFPLADSGYATIALAGDGSIWLGSTSEVVRLAPTDTTAFGSEGGGLPHFLGTDGQHAYLATTSTLLAVSADSVHAVETGQSTTSLLDVRGRWLLSASGMGAVTAYILPGLDPVWGWGDVGSPGFALAASPEGDRVYQGVAQSDYREDDAVLVRDLQTGRILHDVPTPVLPRFLAAAPDGVTLVGAGWDDGGGRIFALRWSGGSLEALWDRRIAGLDLSTPILLHLGPGGARLGLLSPNDEAGLRVLDTETGEVIDRWMGEARDFAFHPDGTLYLLRTGEIWRLR